jgi:folate-binding protein YgfZ
LPLGGGCEALLANAKAKVIARFLAFRVRSEGGVEDLWLDLDPGFADKTLKHLDRFLISEQVELADRTAEYAQIYIVGTKARAVLEQASAEGLPELTGLQCAALKFVDARVQLRSNPSLGLPGFDLVCARTHAESVWKSVLAAGAHPAGMQTYHVLRVEAGTPLYGQDIDENNLAMEIGRTEQAISYSKGCFPGQEPIVRARDLGHVNWSFRGLKLAGDSLPAVGTKLLREGKEAGHVTSAVLSPRASQVLALGYVRRGSDAPGTRLELDAGRAAEVSSLPFVL